MIPQLTIISERNALPTKTHADMSLLIDVTSPSATAEANSPKQRPAGVNLALVLDRSGSMGSQRRLHQAKRAAHGLIDQLASNDQMSIVSFASEAEVLATALSGDQKELLHDLVETVQVRGQTDLQAGWLTGAHKVAAHFRQGYINRVVLLSDGMANRGVTRSEPIAAHVASLCRTGVSTTTVGVGDDFNEDLLAAMAEAGDGNYYYAPTAEDLPYLFEAELNEQRLVIGTRAVLKVLERAPGVRVMPMSDESRTDHNDLISLGNLVTGKSIKVVVDTIIAKEADAQRPLLTFELTWRDTTGEAHAVTADWRLPRVADQAYSELPSHPVLVLEKALASASKLKQSAAHMLDRGNLHIGLFFLEQALKELDSVLMEPAAKKMRDSIVALRGQVERGESKRSSKQAKYESLRHRRKGE
jgi:Ca-activated chloride channel homolog